MDAEVKLKLIELIDTIKTKIKEDETDELEPILENGIEVKWVKTKKEVSGYREPYESLTISIGKRQEE